ncbi:MAG: Glucose-responsive transcription factor [Phylliscum demangeonii]|nr:MAG: Glucose-responsive transcription factor [Phylliscum demangeonii]
MDSNHHHSHNHNHNHRAASPNMQAPPTYPSPSAAAVADGAGPFFAHQQRLSSPDDLRLSSAPLSRAPVPMMTSQAGPDPNLSLHHSRPAHQSDPALDQFHQHNHVPSPTFADAHGPARKRSKASRACDECRRKKIRCDATTESSYDPCTNCKRVNNRCLFSRVPQKRGPNKGYIKELADRLETVENVINQPHPADLSYNTVDQSIQSPRPIDAYSPPSLGGLDSGAGRKRTYSVSESTSAAYLPTIPPRTSLGAWHAHEPARHLPQPTPSAADLGPARVNRSQLSPNGVPSPSWKPGAAELGRRDSVGLPADVADGRVGEHHPAETLPELDELALDTYYQVIHPTLPLLPNSRSRLRSRLAHCPATLREAFLDALGAVAHSSSSTTSELHRPRKAADLLAAYHETQAPRTVSANLVHLQTLILMAVDVEIRGPSASRVPASPPSAVWLGAAVGLANSLKLHAIHLPDSRASADDDASAEGLGRRIWWVLVILDRWHAASNASPVLIPDSSVCLEPEDQELLGEASYNLARISCVIGHAAEVMIAPDPPTSLVTKLLRGETERWREGISTEALKSSTTLQLAYLHVTLLVAHSKPTTEPSEMLSWCVQMTNLLRSSSTPITPLHHHFASMAAATLIGLADVAETSEDALSALSAVREALDRWRIVMPPHGEGSGWEGVIRELVLRKQPRQQTQQHPQQEQTAHAAENPQGGLQHLADLAVGGTGSGAPSAVNGHAAEPTSPPSSSPELDLAVVMKRGYLSMLLPYDGW